LNFPALALLIAATVLFAYLRGLNDPKFSGISSIGDGGVYGIALGWCWVSSIIRNRWARFGTLTLIACTFALLLSESSRDEHDWLRYATQLGGMIVTQSVLFHVFKVPHWQWNTGSPMNESAESGATTQFRILDVMMVTLAYGVLMGLARHYLPPFALQDYWPTAVVISLYFPLMAMLVAHSGAAGKQRYRYMRLVSICLLVAIGAAALSWIQAQTFSLSLDQAKVLFVLNILSGVGFVVAVAFFPLAGVFGQLTRRPDLPREG
tara:strand:+ start:15468 stop:16259 length:792 start_codon:yes stop_codon:yes gene_type:complete